MSIDSFLSQFIDGYLLSDLETMSHDNVAAGKEYGAVGYPMMTTILAGMELLGGLLLPSEKKFDPDHGGHDKFLHFWDYYFCTQFPAYKGLGGLFYSLIRNGVAHTFIAKHGIVIHKFSKQSIKVDLGAKEVYVDPNVFFEEFRDTYHTRVVTIEDKSLMQQRLNKIERAYAKKSDALFNSLQTVDQSVDVKDYWPKLSLANQAWSSGASHAMGPVDGIQLISTTNATTVSGTLSQDKIQKGS